MGKLKSLITKEFIQLKRDPKMLWLSIIAPVVQLILLGFAANLDVENIPALICDMDNTKISREYVESFSKTGSFNIEKKIYTIKEIDKYINNGEVSIVLVIRNGFQKKIKKNKIPEVAAIVDGSDSNTATIGLNFSSMINKNFNAKMIKKRILKSGKKLKMGEVEPRIRIEYNQNLESRNFMVPGILGLVLLITTMVLSSLAIVKEKEKGTLEQVMVTPVKSWQLIIGKLIPFAIVGILDIILVIFVSGFILGVPVKGSILLIFMLTIIYLISTLGLGLFISTISKTQQQAMLTSVFFIITPMVFLSGFIFPIENMPWSIRIFTYIFPLRYFLVIIRTIFIRGGGIATIWLESLILLITGLIIFGISNLRFKKKVG
ncbi:MAG TPA: ABC transporter permease [Candidatus Mcinerneyibacterium sp.]|nr:ABC transporter permease [Candidatus Mcinerneyibacterium sp.]